MVFLRARQIQSRNKSHKSGAVEKKDGAGSLAESHFSGQSRIKVGGEHRPGSVGQVVVAQGFSRDVRKASLTLKMQDCFRLTPKSEGPPVVSFKLWPPLLYSSCNEAIIHNDKILESICIIHFFS